MSKNQVKLSLKALRNLRNITQKQLATMLERNETTILNWETGKTNMGISDYFKIKEILDPEDDFFLEVKSS